METWPEAGLRGEVRAGAAVVGLKGRVGAGLDSKAHAWFIFATPENTSNLSAHVPFTASDEYANERQFSSL